MTFTDTYSKLTIFVNLFSIYLRSYFYNNFNFKDLENLMLIFRLNIVSFPFNSIDNRYDDAIPNRMVIIADGGK